MMSIIRSLSPAAVISNPSLRSFRGRTVIYHIIAKCALWTFLTSWGDGHVHVNGTQGSLWASRREVDMWFGLSVRSNGFPGLDCRASSHYTLQCCCIKNISLLLTLESHRSKHSIFFGTLFSLSVYVPPLE